MINAIRSSWTFLFFFFNDTATTEIYTLSLHDALPISSQAAFLSHGKFSAWRMDSPHRQHVVPVACRICESIRQDRKSTRLNSSHQIISYAFFCLKKKTESMPTPRSSSTC